MPQATQGKVVFIAHPVRGDVEGNLKKVQPYIRYAISQGHHPCCPWYAMLHALDESNEYHRRRGLEANFAILVRCDELWVCGPILTPGMIEEIDRAQTWRIPVVYVKGLGVGDVVIEKINKHLRGVP